MQHKRRYCYDYECYVASGNQILSASSHEPRNWAGPVGGTNFVFCSYGKFNLGYRDEKCPKGPQNTRGTVFGFVSDFTSHVQLKMFCHRQSRYPGWSVHMGKISSSVTKVSVTGPADLLVWTHQNLRKEKSGEARCRKLSQPSRPGSYEEALRLVFARLLSVANDHCHYKTWVIGFDHTESGPSIS